MATTWDAVARVKPADLIWSRRMVALCCLAQAIYLSTKVQVAKNMGLCGFLETWVSLLSKTSQATMRNGKFMVRGRPKMILQPFLPFKEGSHINFQRVTGVTGPWSCGNCRCLRAQALRGAGGRAEFAKHLYVPGFGRCIHNWWASLSIISFWFLFFFSNFSFEPWRLQTWTDFSRFAMPPWPPRFIFGSLGSCLGQGREESIEASPGWEIQHLL